MIALTLLWLVLIGLIILAFRTREYSFLLLALVLFILICAIIVTP